MGNFSVYSAKLVALKLLRLPSSEAPLIDEVWKFLFHELINLRYGLVEAFLRRAGDVKV